MVDEFLAHQGAGTRFHQSGISRRSGMQERIRQWSRIDLLDVLSQGGAFLGQWSISIRQSLSDTSVSGVGDGSEGGDEEDDPDDVTMQEECF